MRKLSTAIIPFLVCLAADLHAAMEASSDSPSSDSSLTVWILVIVFAFFALLIGFTWQILKAERKRMLEDKPPE